MSICMESCGSRSGSPKSIATSDYVVPSPGNDGISCLKWSPTANILSSGNWDGGIRCWQVQEQGQEIQAFPRVKANHQNNLPVLSICFSSDGSTLFSGGCDNAVRMWKFGQTLLDTTPPQIGSHDRPVKSVGFLKSRNLVVSGGWDSKLKFWDTRSPTPAGEFNLPDRVYDMDVQDNLLVVATGNRQILVYDCSSTPRECARKESPLKYQTRCIACFPDATGFAVGGIEGRIGIEYLSKPKESFTFRCHRQKNDNVYPVNDIVFHQEYGTCVSVGGDGVMNVWDKDNRKRLKTFGPTERTLSTAAFSAHGSIFAYASSYDWSRGSTNVQPGNDILIHRMLDNELRLAKKTSA